MCMLTSDNNPTLSAYFRDTNGMFLLASVVYLDEILKSITVFAIRHSNEIVQTIK
jgi:hypothetical protein